MPLFKKFQNIFIIAMVTSLLLFSGCSYIPWIGEDEDDLAFEEDFPFEDEQARQGGSGGMTEDEFFSEGGGGFEEPVQGQGGFASVDQSTQAQEIETDVENLQSQQESLISKVRELEELIYTLEPKISATQERLEGSLSTISSRSEFLEPEVEELKAQIVELKAELERLRAEQAQMAAPPPAPTPRKAARQSRPRTPQTPPEYRNALEAYRNGNYDESILLFQNLALSNPPPSLEDNIVFWIGNNYFQLEMYDDAIKQFETVLNNYPRGNKVHDSRYMMGLSYVRKGSTSQGIEILQSALRNNPPAEVRGKILAKLNEIQ